MAKCPHCSEAIESLPGFLPQADLEERLKKQRDPLKLEITALTTEVVELRPKASSYDAVVLERNGLQGQIDSRTQKDARTTLFVEHKVDPGLIGDFETMHASSQVGVADDAKKTFEDWVATDAKSHVLLSPHYGADTPPPPPDPNAGSGQNGLPPTPPGHAPPPPPHSGKYTNVDIQAIFASPAYQALDSAGKRAKMAEMKQGKMA